MIWARAFLYAYWQPKILDKGCKRERERERERKIQEPSDNMRENK